MTAGLYEDHYLPVAAGCPIFMAMEQKDKRAMVKKAQLCEAKDVAVRDCVNIDYEAKKITCKLP